MEKTTAQKTQLGIFVIIGSILFILAIYFIGSKQQLFGKTEYLNANFSNVSGLQIGNNVRYSGINVGTVSEIKMVNDTSIIVKMAIAKDAFSLINKNSVASIGSDGLVGNMIINITPGKGSSENVKPNDVINSFTRFKTDDMLNTLNVTNQNAALLTTDLLKITKEITQGKGSVGLLINDTVMANDLKETMRYLKQTSKGTSESVASLNKLITSLNKNDNVIGVLKDTSVANQIKNIVIDLDKSSEGINKVVTNLNQTILNVKEGKGALNYLSNDPKLVEKIDTTMSNISESSVKLNENLEALKSNFLLRGYFKKQEKKKLKQKNNNPQQ